MGWKAPIRGLTLSALALLAVPAFAAQNAGKISGVVLDSAGTPQMGATVLISAERVPASAAFDLLTNDRGRFSTEILPVGEYTLKVTLAGFLPALEQHIRVTDQRTTLVQIILGSVFSSFEQLRRHPDEKISADDWTWVLRSSPDNRSVLRWTDGPLISDAEMSGVESAAQKQQDHVQMQLTSGSDHPGSIGAVADSPGTAVVYDLGVGSTARLLMAGQFSYGNEVQGGAFAAEWLPSGEVGAGPKMVLEARESQIGPTGPIFRGLRMSDSDQLAIGDRLSIRYGAEFLAAGFGGTTQALRPHGELAIHLSPTWLASAIVAARAPEEEIGSQTALQSALDSLDDFPILMVRQGRPVLENGWHEELSIDHALGKDSDISAAVFHDRSSHTALIGRGDIAGPEFVQGSLADVFAYDGGISDSTGARFAYRQRLSDSVSTTIVYAYAGALAPGEDSDVAVLRNELSTQYRHSIAGRVTAQLPRLGTKVSTGYKWISSDSVSRIDSYGESLYHIDPYLSMQVRQPLPKMFPCHMEIMANVGNLLAQGYVPLATKDGEVVLVPSYRYFTGGLSLQF